MTRGEKVVADAEQRGCIARQQKGGSASVAQADEQKNFHEQVSLFCDMLIFKDVFHSLAGKYQTPLERLMELIYVWQLQAKCGNLGIGSRQICSLACF